MNTQTSASAGEARDGGRTRDLWLGKEVMQGDTLPEPPYEQGETETRESSRQADLTKNACLTFASPELAAAMRALNAKGVAVREGRAKIRRSFTSAGRTETTAQSSRKAAALFRERPPCLNGTRVCDVLLWPRYIRRIDAIRALRAGGINDPYRTMGELTDRAATAIADYLDAHADSRQRA